MNESSWSLHGGTSSWVPPPVTASKQKKVEPSTTAPSASTRAEKTPTQLQAEQTMTRLSQEEKVLQKTVSSLLTPANLEGLSRDSHELLFDTVGEFKGLVSLGVRSFPVLQEIATGSQGLENLALSTGIAGAEIGAALQLGLMAIQGQQNHQLNVKIAECEKEILFHRQNPTLESAAKIDRLKQQVEACHEEKTELATAISLSVAKLGLHGSASTMFIAGAVATGEAANVINIVAGGISLGGSALGVVLGLGVLIASQRQSTLIEAERQRLTNMLKDPQQEAVAHLISLRLQKLDQDKRDLNITMTQQSLVLAVTTAGTAVSAAGLIIGATGITVSSQVLLGLTTAGIGTVTVSAALLAIGLGYLAYKNREILALKAQDIRAAVPQKINQRAAAKLDQQINNLYQQIEENQENLQLKTQEIAEQINYQTEILNNTEKQIENLLQQGRPTGKQAEQLQHLFALRQEAQVQIDSLNKMVHRQITKELDMGTQEVNLYHKQQHKSADLEKRLQKLTEKRQELALQEQVIKLCKKFPNMNPQNIHEAVGDLTKVLQKEASRPQIEEFLAKEGFVDPELSSEPIVALFRYLTQPAHA